MATDIQQVPGWQVALEVVGILGTPFLVYSIYCLAKKLKRRA